MIQERDLFTFQVARHTAFFSMLGGKGKPMKVFLVDDSLIFRQRLKRMLADVQEVKVIGEAGDAREATNAILKQKPDVVLLDIHLLNGSGIDVLQSLKKMIPAPAVIVLTNYPYPQYRQKCLETGADFFFVKSTQFDQVVPALKQLDQRARNSVARPPTE
jgi:DNA-binding NarL/FixJ family response regulator